MFAPRLFFSTCSLALVLSSVATASTLGTVHVPNNEFSALKRAQLLGPINPQQEITFTVWLKLRNKKQFDHLVEELYDPKSPRYQQFLTYEEYKKQYAPDAKAIRTVEQYFSSQGMRTRREHTLIQVTAKASQIEKTLQIKLNNYSYRNKPIYGNASAPKINAEIAPYVLAISNLSNMPGGYPKIHQHSLKQERKGQNTNPIEPIQLVWNSFTPQAQPTTTSLNGFTGQQISTAYNVSNVAPINGQTIDGTGQTIVIIDGCGTYNATRIMTEANEYNTANSLPQLSSSNFTVLDHTGQPYDPTHCSGTTDWNGEIALDVEASHTIAPGANIVLILTDDVNNSQVSTAIVTLLANHFTIGGFSNAYVISNSWDNNTDNQHEPLDATLQIAAAMGASLNFAAGDCGDQTYASSWPCSIISANPSIEFPASSTYVTAVAGTSLFVDSNYNYAFESGWGNYLNGLPYSGSMGGISQWRSFPAWQAPISSFIAGGYGVVGSHNRAIPDIAMDADYYTGLIIYEGGNNNHYQTGGASQSTPLFSGVLTLVNQARALLNQGIPNPIGQAAPYLYTYNNHLIKNRALNLVSPPHQIISGATPVNNAPLGSTPPNYAFNLVVGSQTVTFNWDGPLSIIEDQFWNDVVGVGSPNVPNFVSTMARL